MSNIRMPLIAGAAVAAMMVGSAAYAEMTYTADLSPSAEVPPTESSASGSADITVDTEAMTISWTTEVDGLTGDPTAAHIHGPAVTACLPRWLAIFGVLAGLLVGLNYIEFLGSTSGLIGLLGAIGQGVQNIWFVALGVAILWAKRQGSAVSQ